MSITTSLFDQALLAEAAYADFSDPLKTKLQALKDAGFSETQATEFVNNWRVVHHQQNLTSGFSATLFEYIGNDPNSP